MKLLFRSLSDGCERIENHRDGAALAGGGI